MIRISAAAAAVLLLGGGSALAQTSGQALAVPRNVQPAPSASANGSGATPAPDANPDPWEGFNRKSYNFSMQLDTAVIGPAARTYKRALPQPVRTGIHNFVQNIGEPVVFLNDVLQGRLKSAGGTAVRFLGNTTVGAAGFLDPMTQSGLPHHDNGFGLTLGRYGVQSGPYIYVPVFGPTTIRDGIGSGVDSISGPLTWISFPGDTALGISTTVAGGLDIRANVDDDLKSLNSVATDPYATVRSAYLQNKQAQISGGDTQLESLPDFPDDQKGAAPPARATPPRTPPAAGPGALPDFPDNPPSPTPPADAPRPGSEAGSDLAGLY